jgi:hypothetical protein
MPYAKPPKTAEAAKAIRAGGHRSSDGLKITGKWQMECVAGLSHDVFRIRSMKIQ